MAGKQSPLQHEHKDSRRLSAFSTTAWKTDGPGCEKGTG